MRGNGVKTILSRLLKCAAFLLILLSLLLLLSRAFAPGNNSAEGGMDNVEANGILGERKSSVDVLIVGDSEAYSSVSPMQMWKEYGFTSYVCGTSSQTLPLTLNFVERVFKCQSPKLVLLETNEIFREYSFSDYAESRAERLFPIFKFHNRWKTMKWSDLFPDTTYTWTNLYKGYRYNTTIKAADASHYMQYTDKTRDIPGLNLQCLKKIQQICEENNAQLILFSTPSTVNWSYVRHNSIKQYAESSGLTYIDLNLMPAEVPIDWTQDTRDKGDHLNCYGAAKVSAYLGKYLHGQYKRDDHRNDKGYAHWNDDLNEYQSVTGQS